MNDLLKGKKALVIGVANKRSLAWGITNSFLRAGADVALTYQGDRLKENVLELAAESVPALPTFPCDVTKSDEVEALVSSLGELWGGIDILVHAVAFAKKQDMAGRYVDTEADNFLLAHEVSVHSLVRVSKAVLPLFEKQGGGSIITLTYIGSERVIPNYNVMGVAKAGLEASVRYLASDLGPLGVRVNAISAGPVKTLAASGIRNFSSILTSTEERAPLRRNVTQEEVGDAATFYASPLARAITGTVLYVDNGLHLLGV